MSIVIKLTEQMKREAAQYAYLSHDYTSRRHDFHAGGAEVASRKMYEGKLGEKAFKSLLIDNEIFFIEDSTSHEEADLYDFLVGNIKIDIKTRTEDFHIRTMEMVEQFNTRPKDMYVGARYREKENTIEFYGYCDAHSLSTTNPPQGFGYKQNYWLYDYQMRPIEELVSVLKRELDNL